ncbi:MAG: Ig-like domain-containing protein [Fodinibius sp.]|nr:Ig-like domain-containing protein [Fodinibius sp.]
MKHFSCLSAVLLVLILLAGSCATPSSPTGGPPDKTGPAITNTEPETGTTNFSGRSIILHFSEFVERSSLRESIVVEPDIGIEYDLDWGRKSVEIVFSRDIPDLTTLIVTVGTQFQDRNGNKMSKPQEIAVSTGPEIDKGKTLWARRRGRQWRGQ